MHIAIPEEYFAGRKHKHDCTQSMIIEESEVDSAKCEIFKNGSLVEKRACSESAYLKRLEEEACELAESGDFQAAAERFQRLCAADGATPRHFEMKAQIHMELGEYWEAIKASTRSVELDGEWVDVFLPFLFFFFCHCTRFPLLRLFREEQKKKVPEIFCFVMTLYRGSL